MLSADWNIQRGTLYNFVTVVYNPPERRAEREIWRMSSYVDATRTTDKALDESQIPGFPIHLHTRKWEVSKQGGLRNGRDSVSDVDFQMTLPDPLQDGDR